VRHGHTFLVINGSGPQKERPDVVATPSLNWNKNVFKRCVIFNKQGLRWAVLAKG
jgi:hypothetical protein